MLPFSGKKTVPPGPHDFVAEIEIECPASAVYPLLDFADPRNAKRQLGDKVEAVVGTSGRFDLVVDVLPDAVFNLTVTAEVRNSLYAFDCVSDPLFGRVVRSHERYALEELGADRCRLTLTNTVHFEGKLHTHELEMESMMLNFANSSALAKYKLHAEEGTEAVREVEAGQAAWLDTFSCDDD